MHFHCGIASPVAKYSSLDVPLNNDLELISPLEDVKANLKGKTIGDSQRYISNIS